MVTKRGATKRGKKRKCSRRPKHKTPQPALKGVIFDLCCGKYEIMKGLASARGRFRVTMEAHGFEIVIDFDEEQASTLGADLTACVAESREEVN